MCIRTEYFKQHPKYVFYHFRMVGLFVCGACILEREETQLYLGNLICHQRFQASSKQWSLHCHLVYTFIHSLSTRTVTLPSRARPQLLFMIP